MAYSKNQNTEHPSKTVVKLVANALQTDQWPRVMLLCGKEEFLVNWSKNYIKKALINPAAEALDCTVFGSELSGAAELISACETFPLMSKRKLVIVENSDILTAQTPKDLSSGEISAIADYITKLSESTLLIFTCGKPNRTKALYKAIAKCGIIYDFTPLDDATLSGWIAKRLKAAGKAASPADILSFAKSCGYGEEYTLYNLENDLKKILASTDRMVLTLEDFTQNSGSGQELNAFRLIDSAFSGNKTQAFSVLSESIDLQTSSKEMGVVLSFIGLICSQLEIMTEAAERKAEGQSFPEILSAMQINEYRLKKALQVAGKKTPEALRKSLDSAFMMEKDLKSGNMEARLALELFIANL